MNRIKKTMALAIVLMLLLVISAFWIGDNILTTSTFAGLRLETDGPAVVSAAGSTATPYQITASADDVNQDGTSLNATAGKIWIGNGASTNSSYAGLRFRNIAVPRGATITSAKLQLYSTSLQTNAISFELAAEAADNSAAFSSTSLPSQRVLTSKRTQIGSTGQWNDNTWYSFDVAPSVQEVVSRSGWASGNKLSIIAHGLGSANQNRMVKSYDGNANYAAQLIVTYSTGIASTATPIKTNTPQPATATPIKTNTTQPATATPTSNSTPRAPNATATKTSLPTVMATPTQAVGTNCNVVIPAAITVADGRGNYAAIKPGNTVCLAAGSRQGLKLLNFKGTATAPIKFINSGGKVVINAAGNNGDIGIQLYGSQYIKLSGAGDPSVFYGIEIGSGANAAVDTNHAGTVSNTDGTEYVEFDHIYAHNVGAGFRVAKNNDLLDTGIAWSGHQYYIHDNYIKTTNAEAMYIGTSDTHGIFPIYDVQVWNNRIDDAGYDGIQIRQAHTKVLVHDNYINGTGRDPCKNGSLDNTAGFNIAKLTDSGDWYNNTVIGARTAFYISNSANVRVYNNLVIDSGHATSGLTDPQCHPAVTSTPPEGAVQILNASNVQYLFNTIVNPNVSAAYGITLKGSTGTVHDNIVGGNFASLITGTGMTLSNNLANGDLNYFKFANIAGGNWHLTSTSPSLNVASESTMPSVDMDNVGRPQGSKSDVGAYEYH